MQEIKTDVILYINPIYQLRIWNCLDSVVWLFGGAGSGKSVFAIQLLILKYLLAKKTEHPERILFVRKVGKTISQSLWTPTIRILKKLRVYDKFEINKTEKTITSPFTENAIVMTGLDDSEKIKSIFGITKVFYEEITEGEENDFLQLVLRMRGDDYKGVFQFFGAFNPVNDKHWLVKHVEPQYLPENERPESFAELEYLNSDKTCWRFASVNEDGTKTYTTVLNTNYKHNRKLDAGYATKLKLLAGVDDVYYQVYEKGRWGHIVAGNAYCHQFRESKHVKPTKYTPKQPIHYTLDFNVNPHMTGLCLQMSYENKRYKVRVFKQYALKHPQNEGYHLGASFVADFLDVLVYEVFLYGDASGNNRLGISDSKSLFSDVMKGFGKHQYGVHKRVPNSNPRYDKIAVGAMGRKSFTNAIFSGELGVDIEIDSSCTELIADLRQCTQDANGKLAKPKNKDGYEERGHALQALEYALCHKDFLGSLALLDYIPNNNE